MLVKLVDAAYRVCGSFPVLAAGAFRIATVPCFREFQVALAKRTAGIQPRTSLHTESL